MVAMHASRRTERYFPSDLLISPALLAHLRWVMNQVLDVLLIKFLSFSLELFFFFLQKRRDVVNHLDSILLSCIYQTFFPPEYVIIEPDANSEKDQ